MKDISFTGSITKATPDGRSAVVTLDVPVSDRRFAVISPETQGRTGLMGEAGRLKAGTRVSGTGSLGPESVRAVTVAAANAVPRLARG